jgi:hypothetical protein
MDMKERRAVPATELRVHFGEALKALDREDIIVEKGGVPVALLTRYEGVTAMATAATSTAWGEAVVKAAEPGGWARAESAMARGWSGVDADELVAHVRRSREEGTRSEPVTLGDQDHDERWPHDSEIRPSKLIADEPGEYRA